MELSQGGRSLLQGRGPELETLETEGQMIHQSHARSHGFEKHQRRRLTTRLHHCYREKPGEADEPDLTADDKQEAEKNSEWAMSVD